MPVIKNSVDLVNSYSDISDFCHKYREPVFITRNGEGDLAVMSIETYEEITGKQRLYHLLDEADNDVENGSFLTEEQMEKEIELM